MQSLSNINQDVRAGKYRPIIHIEAHGNKDNSGLVLASEEPITWQEMKGPLSIINEATRLNLIVCVSACYGALLVKSLETNDRAPCWALVGPVKEMYPNDLLKDFTGFYEDLFKTKSGSIALQRFKNKIEGKMDRYFFTTAEWFFEDIWVNYFREHCSDESLNSRMNAIRRDLKKNNCTNIPSRNELKKDLLLNHHPKLFNRSKEKFFMMDLFHENRDRFLVNYDSIIQKAQAQPLRIQQF